MWKFCPKVKHHGVKVVNTATAIAVCVFNDGTTALDSGGNSAGTGDLHFCVCEKMFKDKDIAWIIMTQKQAVHASKEEGRRRRLRRIGGKEEDAEREGFPYMWGGH